MIYIYVSAKTDRSGRSGCHRRPDHLISTTAFPSLSPQNSANRDSHTWACRPSASWPYWWPRAATHSTAISLGRRPRVFSSRRTQSTSDSSHKSETVTSSGRSSCHCHSARRCPLDRTRGCHPVLATGWFTRLPLLPQPFQHFWGNGSARTAISDS